MPPSPSKPKIRPRDEQDVVDVDAVESKPAKPHNSADASNNSKPEKVSPIAQFFAPKSKAVAGAAGVTGAAGGSSSSSSEINLKQYVMEPEWAAALAPVFDAPFVKNIEKTLATEEKAGHKVFPPRDQIFSALNVCPLSKVRVVLIGQDPYHDDGQAHGMCFSVRPGVKVPPSLRNMYKELETDIAGFKTPPHGYLMAWAQQGVLMLNATLTVQAHKANSHEKCGWQDFTDRIIDTVNKRKEPAVFLLWGNFAKQKAKRVDRSRHKVIETAHPSPLSAKLWFGCKAFSKCNTALTELKQQPINWQIPAVA